MNTLLMTFAVLLGSVTTTADVTQLVEIRENLEMLRKLNHRGYDVQLQEKEKAILSRLSEVTQGKVTTYEELVKVTGGDNISASREQRVKGWLSFGNIVLISATILLFCSGVALFSKYFLALILLVPAQVWNFVLWSACLLGAFGSASLGDMRLAAALPAVFGMIACCSLTHFLYLKDKFPKPYRLLALFLTIIWGATAVHTGSHIIGFMSVMALLSSLGLFIGVIPGVVSLGFDDDDLISNATFCSGIIFWLHVVLTAAGKTMGSFEVFREGMGGLCCYAFYFGLLIMSSKWYNYGHKDFWDTYETRRFLLYRYVNMQILTVGSGVMVLYFGSMFGLTGLLGVGGTLFYIYLIEKYYEIPWKGVGWLWSAFGLGAILYVFAVFIRLHPEYFIFSV